MTPKLPPPETLHALLIEAVRAGDDEATGALIRAGADIERADERGFTPLMLAAYNGHPSTVRLLLGARARVDAPGDPRGATALIGVAFKGDEEVARALLDGGADPDAVNAVGQTALMTAVMFRRLGVARLLLGAGADPDRLDLAGASARNIAARQEDVETVELLARSSRLPLS